MTHKLIKSVLFAFSITSILFACAPKKKVTEPVMTMPTVQAPKVEEPVGNLVPFTRELFFKLKENGLDIKKLKFYVDKTIVLNRVAAQDNLEINELTGTLINKKGITDNQIKITPQVSGIIETIEADGVRLNFGRPNSSLKFINNSASPKFFSFATEKMDKATGAVDVMYNNGTYKATNESNGAPTDIKLMIKQLDIETGMNKPVIEPGAGKLLY